MSDHAPVVRVLWIGPMQTIYENGHEVSNPHPLGDMPAQYLQHRDAVTQEVQNLPAGDLDDHVWNALSAAAKAVVLASGWYELQP